MPACHALTRAGHPCRGHGTPVAGVTAGTEGTLCHMHRDYFRLHRADEHVTELVYAFMTDTERGWILRMLKSPLYRQDVPWLLQHLKELATSRQQSMSQRANYLYELYILAGVLSPMASLQFWRRCTAYNLRVLGYSCKVDPLAAEAVVTFPCNFTGMVYTFFGHLLHGLPPHVALPYLLEHMKEPMDLIPHIRNLETRRAASATIWKEILVMAIPSMSRRILATYPLESILRRVDEIQKDSPQSVWRIPGMREHVLSLLKRVQLVERSAARARFAPLREELMMAAWHPRRVERWLEAGLEPEDF